MPRTERRPYGVLPAASELAAMRDRGMSHQEIAEEVARRVGVPITRAAVSTALMRGGYSQPLKKYPELVPWRLEHRHENDYIVQMLRLEARRRAGKPLTDDQAGRLTSWIHRLGEMGCVVAYDPATDDGFFFTRRLETDDDIVRRP